MGLKQHQIDMIEDIINHSEEYRLNIGDKIELKSAGFNEWEVSVKYNSNIRTEMQLEHDFKVRKTTKEGKRIKLKHSKSKDNQLPFEDLEWKSSLFKEESKTHSLTLSEETKGVETEKSSD